MAKEYDVLLRLMLLGDSGVGKSCLLWRFAEDDYHPSHIATVGIDFRMRTLDINGMRVRVQIWDTAGQERYQTVTKQYYRRAQGILLVYDVTDESSFQHIAKWSSDVDETAPGGVRRILVGNKCDLEQMRRVTTEQGSKLAQSYGMDFFETSAFTSHNVAEAFTCLTQQVLVSSSSDGGNQLWVNIKSDLTSNDLHSDATSDEGTDGSHSTCLC
ncbi:ras-related protein Rab-15-like [Engraulis encrasicolus]|uniref:ras-related protein Rab-15-like n=1 Tax=Engraulis encrasicolus TaxID=184585 RepID=UPI002FD0FC97